MTKDTTLWWCLLSHMLKDDNLFNQTFSRFLLDLSVIGKDRRFFPALYSAIHIVLSDLRNQREQSNNTDQVRHHHQTVEGIGDIPRQRGRTAAWQRQ